MENTARGGARPRLPPHERWLEVEIAMKKRLSPGYQVWVDARGKFHLSHVHIQMARELGLNPKKFGSLANRDQEKWKSPLPQFIEDLYFERFGTDRPKVVRTIEEIAQGKKQKRSEANQNHEPLTNDSEQDHDEDPF